MRARAWLVAAVLAAGCGPMDRPKDRPLVVDETPLGTPRGEVKRWHDDQHEGPVRALFRFDGDRMVASVVYAPVACKSSRCEHPMHVKTELEGPPFVISDDGLTATPVEAHKVGLFVSADARWVVEAHQKE